MGKKKQVTAYLPKKLYDWVKKRDITFTELLEQAVKNKKKEWEVFGRPGDPDHAVEVIGDISKVSLESERE